MRRLSRGRRLSTRRAFAGALILFFMICGLMVVVAQYPAPVDAIRVKRALYSIDKATNALEATNYGETRLHLRRAREALSRSLEQR